MSIEAPAEESKFSPEELEEAKAQLESDALLSEDATARGVIENGGKLPDGSYVSNLSDFLDMRRKDIMQEVAKPITEAKLKDYEMPDDDVMVHHSKPAQE